MLIRSIIAPGMSGKSGGIVAARNRYGTYLRPWVKPVDPQSADQVVVRSHMSAAAAAWAALNAGQKSSWATYAAAIPWLNKLGDTVYLTGPAMFRSCYCAAVRCGATAPSAPPAILQLPQSDATLAAAMSAATQLITVTFDDTLGWAGETGSHMALYMGQPQSDTTNFFKGPYKYAGRLSGNTAVPISSPLTVSAPFTVLAGQKCWVKARIILADGRVSNTFNCFCICSA